MARRALLLLLLASLVVGVPAQMARADGDPGSDVLVYQPLFLSSDAGVSVAEQVRLGALLQAASRAGFPIRVAIIAARSDLGAVTELWGKPRAYARFLGLELSLAYKGPLLVVMPDGLGFNWPAHPTSNAYRALDQIPPGAGGTGLATTAERAVVALAATAGVRVAPPPAAARPTSTSAAGPPASSSTSDSTGALLRALLVLVMAAVAAIALRVAYARRAGLAAWARRVLAARPGGLRVPLVLAIALVAALAGYALLARPGQGPSQAGALAANPVLDPGTSLSRPAPDFTLSDQFGQPVSLHAFRGQVVLMAFNDSECTTLCPLTTAAMLQAKAMLGRAGERVQLLGINANPKATSLEDVLSYSQLHGMLQAWHFLTGPLPALERVWKAYSIGVQISQRQIDHTPALFVIDPQGRLAKLYITQQSYAAVGQLGQELATEAAQLLPDHPPVNTHLSYAQIPGTSPATPVTLRTADGATITAGPRHSRLYLFFATWDQQITGLAGGLEALNRYGALARRANLPPLTAIDEGSVEPAGALKRFLTALPHPLEYPIAIDHTGRLADGYEVQGLPWLMVVNATGRIAWYYSVAALGWPSTTHLIARVREALARAAVPPSSLSAAQAQLAGSPPALAALHQQAARVIGSAPQLTARIRAFHGYPIVLNIWASWCTPCRSEFSLFAAASAQYGHQVAFLGADAQDSPADARAFLTQHPVSYPSYSVSTTDLHALAVIEGLPTTIFINPAGKVSYVHTGQYDAQGTLDGDIQSYAIGH